jgi:hypothetical protein
MSDPNHLWWDVQDREMPFGAKATEAVADGDCEERALVEIICTGEQVAEWC